MKPAAILAAGLATAFVAGGSAQASDKDWRTVSDVGQAGLVALALGTSLEHHDLTGVKQLGLSLAIAEGATYGLKHAFPEERPNGRNDRSFPSGHTSVSFAAAGYLDRRYGWQIGLPATLAAGLVGLARVEAHEHHWYDVVVGAAVGEGAALVMTRPLNDRVMIVPWADTGGGGLSLSARF